MKFVYNDGGRKTAGYKGSTGDCVIRAIAIAAEKPYKEVYKSIDDLLKLQPKRQYIRNGVPRKIYDNYLESIGWQWVATMRIGSGCQVHLTNGELPNGRLIVRVSKHLTAVIDDVIHDTHDPQRYTINYNNGKEHISARCVYGYWYKKDDCHE